MNNRAPVALYRHRAAAQRRHARNHHQIGAKHDGAFAIRRARTEMRSVLAEVQIHHVHVVQRYL